jgi:predicted permease
MLQDLTFAFRVLLKNRAFTVVAILSLAIGIGATSAMFGVADALLLRPLPVQRPSDVVTIESKAPKESFGGMSYRDYVDYRDRAKSLDGLIALANPYSFGFSPRPDALPQIKYGMLASGNFFQAMGVQPELGRGFRPEEDQVPGRDAVVVLGHDFWMQEFSGDRSVVGRAVRLNGVDFNVIGVMPEKFTGMDQYFHVAMIVPMMMSPRLAANLKRDVLEKRDDRGLAVKGRLKPGVTMAQAQAELAGIAKGLEQAYPDTNREQTISIKTELQTRIQQSPPDAQLITILMTMSMLVLLVACANVANLLLSRSRARSREMAVRLAIGAGRSRLVRQLMTESVLIALAGGVLGIAFAYLLVVLFKQIEVPTDLPIVIAPHLDQRVLLVSLAASIVSVLVFGLAPAIQTSRADLVPSLKAADSDSSGKRRLWGRNAMVVAQVAISLVLLVITAMMYRSFTTELGSGPGFRHDHLAMMGFDPTLVRYTEAQTQQFYKQLAERAASVPGVTSAALTSMIPMMPGGIDSDQILPEGFQPPKEKVEFPMFKYTIDEHYFDTLGIAIVRGRGILASDTAATPKVAVVNELVAKKYWPNQDAVGKRFHIGDAKGPWVQVVGVAKMSKYIWIAEPPLEAMYVPLTQNPRSRMMLIAGGPADSASLVAALREAVRGIDPNQPVYNARTMESFYQSRAVNTPNLIVNSVGTMGMMGLVLSMVGLYGIVAYSVSRRTREFGIRMAIGASRGNVLRVVLRQGLILSLIGIGIGLALSFPAGRAVSGLFSSAKSDPMALLIVPPLLLAVTLLAAYAPALRASRVDPMKALRYE